MTSHNGDDCLHRRRRRNWCTRCRSAMILQLSIPRVRNVFGSTGSGFQANHLTQCRPLMRGAQKVGRRCSSGRRRVHKLEPGQVSTVSKLWRPRALCPADPSWSRQSRSRRQPACAQSPSTMARNSFVDLRGSRLTSRQRFSTHFTWRRQCTAH